MAAPTESYVDPSIAANSGTGTIGDPWGDLQYGLDQVTRDATNGDRFNVKSGTAELLTTSLSLTTYGTPTRDAPLIFQGYASAAGDGDLDAGTGSGEIDMQGNNFTIIAAGGGINFMHMHCHGTGSAYVLTMGTDQAVIECEISVGTGGGITGNTFGPSVIGCHIHDTGGIGINGGASTLFNYLKNDGTTDFTTAISSLTGSAAVIGNIISIDGSSNGIIVDVRSGGVVMGNSILAATGSGIGITYINSRSSSLMNNLVEGFSSSGTGILYTVASIQQSVYANNGAFNNTTNYSQSGSVEALLVNDNETLGATPFDKSGADTFANRHTYFSPVNTGNVHGGAFVG